MLFTANHQATNSELVWYCSLFFLLLLLWKVKTAIFNFSFCLYSALCLVCVIFFNFNMTFADNERTVDALERWKIIICHLNCHHQTIMDVSLKNEMEIWNYLFWFFMRILLWYSPMEIKVKITHKMGNTRVKSDEML